MKRYSVLAVASAAVVLSGCVTVEKTSFAKQAGQEVLVRSGRDAILSQTGSTQLIVAPASRTEKMPRPTYVALIRNTGNKPVTLRYSDISVVQTDTGKPLKVWTVDELQSEARGQAIALAILGGVAGVASGYYSGSGTVNGQHYTYSGYNGAAGSAIAGANVRSAAAEGEINVAALENNMLMDNTILPGESYGGAFVFDAAKVAKTSDPKQYTITFKIGPDVHKIQLAVTKEKSK
ncbi:hypothetical protein [Pleomorphomonas sp. JP5]|uniref:hypothetical protein n=1 Tax=Pleomorphomonas sp. JP5 TaxID=2942998 RepID=UPI002044403C|nr:hypothetical protein [Pleomorphomonas sp. JP5]MCM5559157.1 hypothetical protein [Pleomorphomonas sp. JP5]